MNTKKLSRNRRRARVRAKLSGTASRPRVSVFRSHAGLYVQLVDDDKGTTFFGANDRNIKEKNKLKRARSLGQQLAETAKKFKMSQVVFDRGGYAYHGRVKALAEGLRKGGLKF